MCLISRQPNLTYCTNFCFLIRYGKKAAGGRSEDGPSGHSYQSYLVLHAEDDDEATDDTTLLRPPQQGSGEGDLLA